MALSTYIKSYEEKRQNILFQKNSDFSFAARGPQKQRLEVLLIMLLFWKVKL